MEYNGICLVISTGGRNLDLCIFRFLAKAINDNKIPSAEIIKKDDSKKTF